MFYPARLQGTLINQFISSHEDNIAAPEKIALCDHAKRALCVEVTGNLASTAGWIVTEDGLKAQKSLLPYMSRLIGALGGENRTPVWLEYEINDALRGDDCAEDVYMGAHCGALFIPEHDESGNPISCGIVTVINHSDEKQYCGRNNLKTGATTDLGRSGMTICPAIMHIDYTGLDLLSSALQPSTIDRILGRNYSESEWQEIAKGLAQRAMKKAENIGSVSSAFDIGGMLAECSNISILPGLITDACIINGWSDDLREKYARDSSTLSLRYGIFALVLFALTQTGGDIFIPGKIINRNGRLSWRGGRRRRLQTLIMTPDMTGQVCMPKHDTVSSEGNPENVSTEDHDAGASEIPDGRDITPENHPPHTE